MKYLILLILAVMAAYGISIPELQYEKLKLERPEMNFGASGFDDHKNDIIASNDTGDGVVEYFYSTGVLEADPNEVMEKRTNNLRVFTSDGITFYARLTSKPTQLKVDDVWHSVEPATTTQEIFDLAFGRSLLHKLVGVEIAHALSTTTYPNADGAFYRLAYTGSSFQDAITQATADQAKHDVAILGNAVSFANDWFLGKSFMSISIADVGTGYTVSAASTSLWVETRVDAGDGNAINVFECTKAGHPITAFVTTDNLSFNSSTPFATEVGFASISAGVYNKWDFNAAGLTYINAQEGNSVKLVFLNKFEYASTSPTNENSVNISSTVGLSARFPRLDFIYTMDAVVSVFKPNVQSQILDG